MSAWEETWVDADDIPSIPSRADDEWLASQDAASNGARPARGERPWRAEPWSEFRDTAEEEIRWLVHGLLPAGALAFVAAPPKKGKTWLALAFALSVASGRPLFQEYEVAEPQNVLYAALEGSRSAIRARTGSLARGLGIDPESDELERLHVLYRPRPFDLAKPESAAWLQEEQAATDASLVVVDVLRAAARFRENVAEDFALVRDSFEPLLDRQCTIVLLHHFGKLTDTQRDRSPGERMAGTGAMYGALDVGFLITQSQNGARRLRVDIEARDFAAPDALGVVIEGTGSGENGGFRYGDTATFVIDASAAEERDLVVELEELFADEKWRTLKEISSKSTGIGANIDALRECLDDHPERFSVVEGHLVGRSPNARPWGTITMSRSVTQGSESVESHLFGDDLSASDSGRVTPPTGRDTPSHPTRDHADSDSAARVTPDTPSSNPLLEDEL